MCVLHSPTASREISFLPHETCMCVVYVHVHVYVCAYVYVYVYVYVYIVCVCILKCARVYMSVHVHTQRHFLSWNLSCGTWTQFGLVFVYV